MTEWTPRRVEAASGLFAGFANTLVTHPLDLLKVRLQLSGAKTAAPFQVMREVITGISEDAKTAYKANKTSLLPTGPLANRPYWTHLVQQYYRGVMPNLVGNVAAWGLYFLLYAEFKRVLPSGETPSYFAASSLAGICSSVLTNPLWLLKTRILSTLRHQKNLYRLLWHGVSEIYHKEGILAFWRGTVPSLFQVLQASIQFTLYDHTKDYLLGQNSDGSRDLSAAHFIGASIVLKTVSMTLLYPTQVVRLRLQSYNWHGELRLIWLVTKQLWRQGRVLPFYRGLSTNIVRVLPSTCITFLTYETTKKYLGL